MDLISEKAREKFFILGRKLGWLDVSLDRKIKALQDEIETCEEAKIGIHKKNKADVAFDVDKREEMAFGDDNTLTSYHKESKADLAFTDNKEEMASGDGNTVPSYGIGDRDNSTDGDVLIDSIVIIDDNDVSDSCDNDVKDSICVDDNIDDDEGIIDSGSDDQVDDGIIDYSDDAGDNNIDNDDHVHDNNDSDDVVDRNVSENIVNDNGYSHTKHHDGDVVGNNVVDSDDDNVYGGIINDSDAASGGIINDNSDGSDNDTDFDVDEGNTYDSDEGDDVDNGGDFDINDEDDDGDINHSDNHGNDVGKNDDGFLHGSDDGGDDIANDGDKINDDNNYDGENQKNQSGVYEFMANFPDLSEEFLSSINQVDISKEENNKSKNKEETDEDYENMHSRDEHSVDANDIETSNTELFNGEIEETRDETGISEVSHFMESSSYSISNDHNVDSNSQDRCIDSINSFNDDITNSDKGVFGDADESLKHKDIEQEQDIVISYLSNSADHDDVGDLSTEITRPTSSMTDCSNNDENSISESPVKPSLSARLFKKYNPEKSESDADDFELFLQKIRTPKKVLSLSDEDRKREAKSVDEFIVDDNDDDDLEEEVFMDPGFTPEEYDSDKENDDCIEIATPASSYTPLKTPYTDCSWKTAKSTEFRKNTVTNNTPFKTPSADFPWKTPKSTKPKCDRGTSSRPKSVLENLLTSYSTEKDFKKSRERLAKDLFELYNRTVFDNQLPSDFQITWNKKMRSTAGFCYYSKKNGLRLSRIELADKVIDSADRLRDTLIHELCHAASWIISGVKAGHGPVWKKWTLRANFVHQDLPPISRCHSYTINAKYTYRCSRCGNTFGRHSKSVNLEKSRCAHCYGRLELVPQLKKDGTPQTRTPSRFALFVKENFARIKKDNEHFSHQEVMKALSSEFAKLRT